MAILKMDLQYFAGEKTEKATPRKRQESRKKGQLARTNELPSAIIFLLMFILFFLFGSYLTDHLVGIFDEVLKNYLTWEITQSNISTIFTGLLTSVFWVMLPIFAVALFGGLAGNLIQVGFLFTGEPLKAKLERINPLEGAKRIFSKKALVELLKSILKIVLIGYVAFSVIWADKKTLLSLFYYDLKDIMVHAGKLLLEIGFKTSIVLIILALFDYIYQKFDFEKSIRMSKQDIKDEYKKTEGDPLIKGKIKERQRQMAMNRMMQSIPDADVVITNPTHFAVAISYNPKKMEAPQVVAKGMDYVALKIKEVAKEHEVITVENRWLARNLYHQVEIGDAVPMELYQAVAEVLAYVYKVKGSVNA